MESDLRKWGRHVPGRAKLRAWEVRAAVWWWGHTSPAREFFLVRKRAHVHTQISWLLSRFCTVLCAQRTLFCLLRAFSSLSTFPAVSSAAEFTQPPPSLTELEAVPLKNLRFPPSRQLLPLPLTLQVTLPEQHYFDTVPLAAIRIKSAPGCL